MNAEPPAVLVLEHNRRNQALLAELLARHGYRTLYAESLEALEVVLAEGEDMRLALVDLSGFDRRVWQGCELILARGVPLVLIAPPDGEPYARLEGVGRGVLGVLVKPISPHRLLELVGRVASA